MTDILLDSEEVKYLLKESGAIREGHFQLPTGEHTDRYFQLPLALRYYNYARRLSVGLSRLLRLIPQVSAALPNISIVGASPGGIPVAYGIREALQAAQIMWAEGGREGNLHFRQYDEVQPGERCVLVDDLILSGRTMRSLVKLVEDRGGKVLAIGVIVDPGIIPLDFKPIPFVRLVDLPTLHFPDGRHCTLCKEKVPVTPVTW